MRVFIRAIWIFLFGMPDILAQPQFIREPYLLFPLLINPALAGAANGPSLAMTYRQQWPEFPEGPKTQTLASQFPGRRLSFGGILSRDQNGLTGHTGMELALAYRLLVSGNPEDPDASNLLFGFSVEGWQRRVHEDRFTPSGGDPLVGTGNPALLIANVSTGLYFSNRPIFVSLSVRDLIPLKVWKPVSEPGGFQVHLFAGGRIFLSEGLQAEPSFRFRTNRLGDSRLDFHTSARILGTGKMAFLTTLAYHRERLHFKAENQAVSALFGCRKDSWQLSYRYFYPLTGIQTYTWGTHEWLLIFRFGNSRNPGVFCPAEF